MAERGQVARRDASAFDVVGDDRRHTFAARVDEHDGHLCASEPFELVGWEGERQHEQAIGPIAPMQRRDVLAAVQR